MKTSHKKVGIAVVALLLCFTFLVQSALAAQIFILTDWWGTLGSESGQFDALWAITKDNSGNIYVVEYGNNRYQKFNGSGGFMMEKGSEGGGNGQFRQPRGIAVDGTGDVYIADTSNNRIQKFNNSGDLRPFGSIQSPNFFQMPVGVAVSNDGFVYVLELIGQVQKRTLTGEIVGEWGLNGTGNGQFMYPQDIAVDAQGNVFVADTQCNRIQKFNSNGSFLLAWGTDESAINEICPGGSAEGLLDQPYGLDVDANGNVYVADTWNNRVQVFDSQGNFLLMLQSEEWSSDPGEFQGPIDVVVDADFIYVADHWNNRVQKFELVDVLEPTPTPLPTATPEPTPTPEPEPEVLEVAIDVRPGSPRNPVNCRAVNAVIQVAILTTDTFDANTVDHTTVSFDGATETRTVGKDKEPKRDLHDVDGDGDEDLVVHIRLGDTTLTCESTEGTLTGQTFSGDAFEGKDAVLMFGQYKIGK